MRLLLAIGSGLQLPWWRATSGLDNLEIVDLKPDDLESAVECFRESFPSIWKLGVKVACAIL